MFNVANIAELATLLLLAYVAGCVLGHRLHRAWSSLRVHQSLTTLPPVMRPGPTHAARLAMATTTRAVKPLAADPRPQSLPSPCDGTKDDLQAIKGVGPKIEAILNDIGIYHYDQIAAWTQADADWMDNKLGFKGRVSREQWMRQAATLASHHATVPSKVA
ncbi:hypothetical protein [uncultured Devosia sp.]|uniref:hypothetical protein n=1 Tax=uncultured Devosia sp. TaxID=211434 RepID=UPI0035C9B7A9